MICPSRNELIKYINDEFIKEKIAEIKAHIDTCAKCKENLVELAGPNKLLLDIQEDSEATKVPEYTTEERKHHKERLKTAITRSLEGDRKEIK